MREILFRGKDKDDGNGYEGYYLQLHDTTYCSLPSDNAEEATRLNKENEHHYIVFEQMTDWGLPNKHLRAEVLPETVCQYTGLTDRNGKKIFEGDIVKHDMSYTIGAVKWYFEDYAGWCVDDIHIGEQQFADEMWNECEVIGNIFDNPELIGDQP